jgi:hypothetical protein
MSPSASSSSVSSKQWVGAAALFFTFFLSTQSVFAARVTQVKGTQVLIDLEGDDANSVVGKKFIMMVGDKKRAIIEITKAKNTKAIGKILKGKAEVDGTLVAVGGKSSSGGGKKKRTAKSDSSGGATDETYGFLVGMNMANQSVTSGSKTNAMAGNGFSLKGFGDYPIMGDLSLLGRAGVEQFNVTGGSKSTALMYLVGDLLVKYRFSEGSFSPFALGGLGLHYPISKSSDAIDTSVLSVTTVIILGGGANFTINDTSYATASIEYGYFPPGPDVTTSWIALRGGMGFKF